ncbi:MAG: outer membrane protein transport protein [Gallionellaceae bacterium]
MNFKKAVVASSFIAALAMPCGNASASGFALIEQSASGLGNAFAGGAASADDASTIFYNPAGMSRLPGKQFVVGLHGIKPSAKFNDTASVGAALQPQGGTGGDAGSLEWVPNGYFTYQINPQTHIGLGVYSPFGLKTQYDPNWMGRFQAITSKIETVNLNPSVSYDVNDKVTLGAGLNYQHITGTLSSAVNYSAAAYGAGGAPLLTAIGGPGVAGISTVDGSDSAWGYNLGAMFNIDTQTRVGMAYRSRIKYTLTGTISFSGVPAPLGASPQLANGSVSVPLTMPDTFSLSGFHQVDDKWDVMADATWTGWSVLQQLQINRSTGANVQTVQENWNNTWRVSVGGNYHYNSQWTSRIGVALDQAPVSDAYRTARIPDGNRTWLAVGGQYKPGKDSALDFGYAHLFVSNAAINQNMTAIGAGALIGSYDDSVDILSIQYSHDL